MRIQALSSRYAKPTQKQSNQDQYQSGPKKKPLTVNILLSAETVCAIDHRAGARSRSVRCARTRLIFTTTSKVKKAVKKSSSTTQTSDQGGASRVSRCLLDMQYRRALSTGHLFHN